MVDEDFQRLLRALAALLPAQLVALDAAVRGQMAVVRGRITAAPASSPEPIAALPAAPGPQPASETAITAPTIAAIEACFAQAPAVPALSVHVDQEMGLGQRLEALSLQGMPRHVQRLDGDAASAASQS